MFTAILSIRVCTELLLKGIFRITSAAGFLKSSVVITSFNANKIKSSQILCGLPVLATNRAILYEARSPKSSCLEAAKKF